MDRIAALSATNECLSGAKEPQETTETSEAALVRKAREVPAAFAELYRRYLPRIYRYLRARTNSDEDAADLTQQVFVQALDALPRYREKGLPFAAWLFRIARNAAINASQRRRTTLNWDLLPDALQAGAGQAAQREADPEAIVLKREALEQLDRMLAELDPDQLELLALRFAGRLTVREMASVIGKREAAVHKQLSRTLQALKVQFKEKYNEE